MSYLLTYLITFYLQADVSPTAFKYRYIIGSFNLDDSY
jgi:hypothetical protein